MSSLKNLLSALALTSLALIAAGCGAEAKTPAASSQDSAVTAPDSAGGDTAADTASNSDTSPADSGAETAAETSPDSTPDTSLADTATASDITASDASTSDTAASDTSLADIAADTAADAAADATAAALGSPCSAPADCGSALFCLTPFNSATGTCVAYHTEGETCMIDEIPCVAGLICTNGAVCYKPKTNAQVGESCHYDKCAPDLVCVGLPQVAQCQAKAEEGAPCTGALPAGCKAGLVCGPDGKCVKA